MSKVRKSQRRGYLSRLMGCVAWTLSLASVASLTRYLPVIRWRYAYRRHREVALCHDALFRFVCSLASINHVLSLPPPPPPPLFRAPRQPAATPAANLLLPAFSALLCPRQHFFAACFRIRERPSFLPFSLVAWFHGWLSLLLAVSRARCPRNGLVRSNNELLFPPPTVQPLIFKARPRVSHKRSMNLDIKIASTRRKL